MLKVLKGKLSSSDQQTTVDKINMLAIGFILHNMNNATILESHIISVILELVAVTISKEINQN